MGNNAYTLVKANTSMKRTFRISHAMLMVLPLLLLCACEKETQGPTWGEVVFGRAKVAVGGGAKFYYGDTSPILIEFVWKAETPITLQKVEFYLEFNETYINRQGELRVARHGGDRGVLFKTLEHSELPRKDEVITLIVFQQDVFNLFKNYTYDYEGDQRQTPVFTNSDKPERNEEHPFLVGDEFKLTWSLIAEDDLVINEWPSVICNNNSDANCALDWKVSCALDFSLFEGKYLCEEPGYTTYPVYFERNGGNLFVNNNFWDESARVSYFIDPFTKSLNIPPQVFTMDGLEFRVTGKGSIDTCTGDMLIDYEVTTQPSRRLVEENTHTFRKSN